MEDDRVFGIVRFSERKRIDDFVRGQFYMNTLAHFADVERSLERRDKDEGQAFWFGDKTVLQMQIDGEFQTIPGIINMAYRHPDDLKANVFCMCALRTSNVKNLDPRNFGFGDTFALLRDGDEFLRRVRAAADKAGHDVKWGLVEYIDKRTYYGPMGVFRKATDFSYQSEFRIALLSGTGSPYVLDVGDLTDITFIGPSADLNRRLGLAERNLAVLL
jgi:hypothetical protein